MLLWSLGEEDQRGRGGSRSGSNNRDTQVSTLQAEVETGTDVEATEPELESEHGVTLPKDINEEMATECKTNVIKEAISHVMATMYGVKASRDTAKFGPTPTTEVLLDDVPVRALLDTGSPSIVSLEFFLRAAATRRTQEQTPADWRKAIKQRLHPTTNSLRSYGGSELQIVSQVRCRIAWQDRVIDTVLQVQKAAPVDLLLGTDVLPLLGFTLVQVGPQASEDLLSCSPLHLETSGNRIPAQEAAALPNRKPTSDLVLPTQTASQGAVRSALVRLIQATKLPGRHSRLIQANVQDTEIAGTTLLFEPDKEVLGAKGVSVADAVVAPGKTVTLLVSNFGCEPVQLEDGETLGQLEPATVADDANLETSGEDVGESGNVAAIQMTHGDRNKRLLAALSLDEVQLPEDGQREQLCSLVLDG